MPSHSPSLAPTHSSIVPATQAPTGCGQGYVTYSPVVNAAVKQKSAFAPVMRPTGSPPIAAVPGLAAAGWAHPIFNVTTNFNIAY
ncbi:hypothetical protein NP493_637g01028 [Ridgeia piscesae]|uniref:Uncharacterized protein n=1 Tax=Ridgeia piscesae TaxID=27915 RepID=A0AAD9KSR7_RIDPI|nr:hypothetical protein NP493_637g01028 [Ridgeia piscesae]